MTPSLRVLITDYAWPDLHLERQILEPVGIDLVAAPTTDEATLCELAATADGILTCWAPVGPTVIEAAEKCRIIARLGIGLDNISLTTATARKIPVTNVPDYCVHEVAEHTLALLLAMARKVAFYNGQAKRGMYMLQSGPPLRRIAGQTLGLVGLGPIARQVARLARGIGLRVIASTPSGNDYGMDINMRPLTEVISQADFLSLHCPLTPETRQLLQLPQFRQMKPTACLINTSRGGLVNHEDLWAALQTGFLAGAALDVFEPEPPDLSHPLFQDERVIVTPHAAFLSVESLQTLRAGAAQQVLDALQGRRPPHVVNPAIYE